MSSVDAGLKPGTFGVSADMQPSTGGVVSVSHPLAARVGRKILAEGGNAVDAAIAIQFALNVVEPYMSGIGGGTYVLFYEAATGRVYHFDAREITSSSLPLDRYRQVRLGDSTFEAATNPMVIGLPGTVRVLAELATRFGSRAVGDLIQPSIELATDGIQINEASSRYFQRGLDRIKRCGESAAVFSPGGRLLQRHDLLVQKELAASFRTLQTEGLDAFYQGSIARALVEGINAAGGHFTAADFANYEVKERQPVKAEVFGYDIVSAAPSTSGGISLLQILKMMEHFDFAGSTPNAPEYLHRLIEVMHLAYADRVTYIGDPDFVEVPVAELLDDAYLASRLDAINDDRSTVYIDPGLIPGFGDLTMLPNTSGQGMRDEIGTETTHYSVVDRAGNMVSFTTSIGQVFGSGITVGGTGILLNNTAGGYALDPSSPNVIAAGKRGLSSITPTFVMQNGRPLAALGSPGATTIIGTVAQTILNTAGFGRPLQESILIPRIYSSNHPRVEWEPGLSMHTRYALAGRGHDIERFPQSNIGDVHAVMTDPGDHTHYGATDDNREGTVLSEDGVSVTLGSDSPSTASVMEPFALRIDGRDIPLAGHTYQRSEHEFYIERSVLEDVLPEVPVAQLTAYQTVIGACRYVAVSELCARLGYAFDWDAVNYAVEVRTSDRPRELNAVQRKYANERATITR